MKKNFIFYVCAAAALVFASCQEKDTIDEIPETPSSGANVIVATALPTKTMTQNGTDVLWKNGDVIGVYSEIVEGEQTTRTSAAFTTSISTPASTAEFSSSDSNVPTKIGDYYYAAYPLAGINQWYYSTNAGGEYRLYFTFNKEQTAVKDGWDAIHGAMAAKSENNNFSFAHFSAYIKFTVGASSTPFNSITVTTNDATNIVDRLRIDLPAMTYSANNLAALRSHYVTLSTADGNNFEQGTYYISIIPRQYPQGFSFTFKNADGETTIINKSGNFTFEGGDVANLGTIGTLDFGGERVPLELATVYKENNVNQGVVFWIDPSDPYKGKIVSTSVPEQVVWAVKTYISDATGGNLGGTSTDDGIANYNQVIGFAAYQENPDNFPAMKYCADLRTNLGGAWYLPTSTELQTLFRAYYGLSESTTLTNNTDYRIDSGNPIPSVMAEKAKFDAALSLLGETISATLDGDANGDGVSDNAGYGTGNGVQYWSSKVNTNGNAQYVRFGNYTYSNGTKTTQKYVRCIREVVVQ